MSENNPYYPAPGPGEGGGEGEARRNDDGSYREQIQHRPVGARVPDAVARGVFSTGALIITGQSEFVIDFVQRMGRPFHVVARIVMPFALMPRFINALEENTRKFEDRFGAIPRLPKPENPRRPSIQEIYDDLKIADDVMSGSYANNFLIGHSHAEFWFDFVTNFFPTSAVSRRVFLSAPQVPPLLDMMRNTFRQFQAKVNASKPRTEDEPKTEEGPSPEPPPGV